MYFFKIENYFKKISLFLNTRSFYEIILDLREKSLKLKNVRELRPKQNETRPSGNRC